MSICELVPYVCAGGGNVALFSLSVHRGVRASATLLLEWGVQADGGIKKTGFGRLAMVS